MKPVEYPKRVAITGIRGFVGRRVVPLLLDAGVDVIGIVRPGRDASELTKQGVEVRVADMRYPANHLQAFDGLEGIVHLSGMAHGADLVPVLEKMCVPQGVFISSAGVYTKLPSQGAEQKREGEQALRDSGIRYTILRPSMIYGYPDDRNMSRLLRQLQRSRVLPVPGAGRTPQQPVHVDDLVDAILKALSAPPVDGAEYDLGGPKAIELREVIGLAASALGKSAVTIPFPVGLSHALVRGLYAVRLPSPVRPEQVLRLNESKAVDILAAQTDLDFQPRPFAVGIAAEALLIRD